MAAMDPLAVERALHALLINVYGGSLIGTFITAILFGVLTVQSARYFSAFPKDPVYIKAAVILLCALVCFQVVATVYTLYWYLVENFGSVFILPIATWEGTTYQTVTVAASFTTQSFFSYRIYNLSHSLTLGLVMEILVLLQCGFGLTTAVRAYQLKSFALIAEKEHWHIMAWLISQGFCDIAIAGAMCYLLWKSRTGIDRTDSAIARMILYTINTGLITALTDVAVCVIFAVKPFHFTQLMLGVPLGAIYSITMLANLHSRSKIRAMYFSGTAVSMHTNSGDPKAGKYRTRTSSFAGVKFKSLTSTYGSMRSSMSNLHGHSQDASSASLTQLPHEKHGRVRLSSLRRKEIFEPPAPAMPRRSHSPPYSPPFRSSILAPPPSSTNKANSERRRAQAASIAILTRQPELVATVPSPTRPRRTSDVDSYIAMENIPSPRQLESGELEWQSPTDEQPNSGATEKTFWTVTDTDNRF